jgi:hypothetical protein
MSTGVPVEKAKFTPKTGPNPQPFSVHFNPVSLQYTVTNTLKEEANGKTKKQYVTQGTGKLTMDLIFDNTSNGSDVRLTTGKVAALMQPDPKSSGSKKQVPSIVLFEWGAYKFQGMMESYKETLDFFSATGVPLRASVNISLVEQPTVFTPSAQGPAGVAGDLTPDAVNVPGGQFDPSSAASAGGNPSAARGIGALNGAASLRFSAGASLTVTGSVTLGPPVAFATGGAGISLGAGAGIGIGGGAGFGIGAGAGIGIGGGAGFGIGAGAGIGIGASAGAGFSASAGASFGASAGVSSGALFGSSASAGVTASGGAFAGLRVSSSPSTVSVETGRFLKVSESVSVSTSNADFAVGGQVVASGTAGLSTDVGANLDLRSRIQFEVE